MAKIVDVAREADVSVATVSRTLNNNGRVDPVLARRVQEAAERLGYRPNAVARNLRRQGTQVWALIITDINNPFYTAVARGVEDVARESGFSVLLCNTDEDLDREGRYLSVAEQEQAAGVILAPSSTDSDVSRLLANRMPLVAIDRRLSQPVDTVLVRSRAGAITATEQLLSRGWERPACITGPADAETADLRADGYRAVMADRGSKPVVRHAPYDTDGGARAVRELFADPAQDRPDSLFIANSLLALGALNELKRLRVRVGRDVGVVAFDDAPWATVIDPPVTVVAQPAYEIGAEAARMLVTRIRNDAPVDPRLTELDPELVVRSSCRRLKPGR